MIPSHSRLEVDRTASLRHDQEHLLVCSAEQQGREVLLVLFQPFSAPWHTAMPMKCEREHTAIPAQTHGSFSTIPHGSFSTIGLFQGLDRVVKVFCHRSCNFRRRHNRHVLARVSACTATNGRRILRFVRSKNIPREPIGSMICHRAHAGDAGALLWTTVPSSRCANGSFSLRACSRAKDRVPLIKLGIRR